MMHLQFVISYQYRNVYQYFQLFRFIIFTLQVLSIILRLNLGQEHNKLHFHHNNKLFTSYSHITTLPNSKKRSLHSVTQPMT